MAKVAYVFAGQGAQVIGMGYDFYQSSATVRSLWDRAEAERPGLLSLMFEGQQQQLDITINTQPCLFLMDLAAAMLLEAAGQQASGAAGFSLGEIPACCYAGYLEPLSAFHLTVQRAQAMQACSEAHPGRMFAILKLPADTVQQICAKLEQAWPANYNSPEQTVVACAWEAAEPLQAAVAAAGGHCLPLAVSGAFHSPLMDAASVQLSGILRNTPFNTPRLLLYSNMTGQIYSDPRAMLAGQINHPVLWQHTIENMLAAGFDSFIELGPGKTLSGLIKKIAPGVQTLQVSDLASLESTVRALEELDHAAE